MDCTRLWPIHTENLRTAPSLGTFQRSEDSILLIYINLLPGIYTTGEASYLLKPFFLFNLRCQCNSFLMLGELETDCLGL